MTPKEASEAYAAMLFPAKEGLHYESARQDFYEGIKWQQKENKITATTLKSIIEAAQATLNLIETQANLTKDDSLFFK